MGIFEEPRWKLIFANQLYVHLYTAAIERHEDIYVHTLNRTVAPLKRKVLNFDKRFTGNNEKKTRWNCSTASPTNNTSLHVRSVCHSFLLGNYCKKSHICCLCNVHHCKDSSIFCIRLQYLHSINVSITVASANQTGQNILLLDERNMNWYTKVMLFLKPRNRGETPITISTSKLLLVHLNLQISLYAAFLSSVTEMLSIRFIVQFLFPEYIKCNNFSWKVFYSRNICVKNRSWCFLTCATRVEYWRTLTSTETFYIWFSS